MTTTAIRKCTDFINKVREFRFIKIRDTQINKFNSLVGNKEREILHKAQSIIVNCKPQITPTDG